MARRNKDFDSFTFDPERRSTVSITLSVDAEQLRKATDQAFEQARDMSMQFETGEHCRAVRDVANVFSRTIQDSLDQVVEAQRRQVDEQLQRLTETVENIARLLKNDDDDATGCAVPA